MEGEAISATIEVLVQNLINLSKEEISLIRGVDANADKLRVTFGMIQSFLDDAETKSITEEAVKAWLKELQAKAFEADNALDELNYQLLYEKVSCFPSFNHYVDRRDVALRINRINTSFESINKRAAELGLREKLAAAPPAAAASVETDSATVDPIFIGRNDDVSRIVEMLTAPTKEAVTILPIVGMGGLGKTTLTRNVFNHKKIETHFGKRIWVHVSQDFDAVALLKKILTNLEGVKVEDESREVVVKKIREVLKDKTYLLVLDDIWNEDWHKWEDFIRSWFGITSTNGNGILVTTRKEVVGTLVKTLDMHSLDYLSDEQCWSIIKDRAFEGEVIPPTLEDIGMSIAKRCKGLPLAANVIGGALSGKSEDEWRSINEIQLSDGGRDEKYISKILKLSFHDLPSPSHKKCFAYCSIFPKGTRINREQLIQLWMAEGLFQPFQTSDMESVGNEVLRVLLHNSLLQVVDKDEFGNINHCSMHDLVHDVASSISYDIYYRRDESSRIPKEQARLLRTLFYNGKITDIIFSDFRSLHSLTLTNHEVEELPDSIRKLIHLRYLDISDTHVRYLPNSINKLSQLQTIRTNSSWKFHLKELPSTLKHLLKLRHLYISVWTVLPPQVGQLTSLQTLPYFKVRNKEGHRIAELGSLKNLKGELKIVSLENVQGEEESKKAYLSQKSGIAKLVLSWSPFREGVRIIDESVLKGVEPHPTLKTLKIDGFSGAKFPTWTSKMAEFVEAGRWVGLSALMEITLSICKELEEISMLGHLPHLKSLVLSGLENVKCIGASFYGVHQETTSVFPALERLELSSMGRLREWEEVNVPNVKVFPCLEYLTIRLCNELRSAPSQFTTLKELEICCVDSELPLVSICGIKLKTLTKLKIECIEELICLPNRLFHNNQHLSELTIIDCPKLIKLTAAADGDGMHNLNPLEQLTLSNCDNLKLTSLRRLSIYGGQLDFLVEMEKCAPNSLEDLTIHNMYGVSSSSYEFNKAADGILLGSHLSLRRLDLSGINPDLGVSLPDQLQHLTTLSHLTLRNFGRMEELPEWLGNLSSLQQLRLWFCPKLKRLPSVEAMRRLTNLTTLNIHECPLLLSGRRSEIQKQTEWHKISHIPKIWIEVFRCST